MSQIVTLIDHNFSDLLSGSNKPWLIDCWSMTCEMCRFNAPVVAQLAELKRDKLSFAKLNVDENPYVAAFLGVRILPALLLYDPVTKRTLNTFGNPSLEEIESQIVRFIR